jgi:hypothetical protein
MCYFNKSSGCERRHRRRGGGVGVTLISLVGKLDCSQHRGIPTEERIALGTLQHQIGHRAASNIEV